MAGTSKAQVPDPHFKMPKSRDFAKNDDSDDDLSTVSTSSRTQYSYSEEERIVKWIIKTHSYSEVGGIVMWRLMESDNAVPGRSFQSMKERFRKHILPKIELFDISEDAKNAFKQQQRKQKKKCLKRLNEMPKRK